jgi:hypothetical protein
MSESDGDAPVQLLQKLDNHVGEDFPKMFLNFNPHGVNAILLIEMSKGVINLYGDYSEMTPMLKHTFKSFDSAVLSSTSIEGTGRKDFLQKSYKIEQKGDILPQKGGFFDGLGGLLGGNKGKKDTGTTDMGRMSGV